MRNLKRALSLALASVMLLGMMVVGTSAASYPDVDENDNTEAIEVLNTVGAMIGDENGKFNPDKNVTRNEMAAVIARLLLGAEAETYIGTHPFTDVPGWAQKYVAACYDAKIVTGRSATFYDGNATVNAQEAATMMLRALGYEGLAGTGADWARSVVAKANQIRLFRGITGSATAPMTRNQIAQLTLNTLESTVVDVQDNTLHISTGADAGNVSITGGQLNYIVRSSKDAKMSLAIGKAETSGNSSSGINGNTVELGEQLYNGDLTKDDTIDSLGRASIRWAYKNKEIIQVAKEPVVVYTSKKQEASDIADITRDLKAYNYDTKYTQTVVTTDGVPAPATSVDANDISGWTGDGYTVSVYADDNRNITYISVVHEELSKVTVVNKSKNEITLRVANGQSIVIDDKHDAYENLANKVAAGDYVLAVTNGTGAATKVVDAYVGKTVDGTVSTYSNKEALTIDSVQYKKSACGSVSDTTYLTRDNYKDTKNPATLYLDSNGYYIAVKNTVKVDADDVCFVVWAEPNSSWSTKMEAYVMLPDGTKGVYTVTSFNNKTGLSDIKSGLKIVDSPASNNATGLYAYTLNDDGIALKDFTAAGVSKTTEYRDTAMTGSSAQTAVDNDKSQTVVGGGATVYLTSGTRFYMVNRSKISGAISKSNASTDGLVNNSVGLSSIKDTTFKVDDGDAFQVAYREINNQKIAIAVYGNYSAAVSSDSKDLVYITGKAWDSSNDQEYLMDAVFSGETEYQQIWVKGEKAPGLYTYSKDSKDIYTLTDATVGTSYNAQMGSLTAINSTTGTSTRLIVESSTDEFKNLDKAVIMDVTGDHPAVTDLGALIGTNYSGYVAVDSDKNVLAVYISSMEAPARVINSTTASSNYTGMNPGDVLTGNKATLDGLKAEDNAPDHTVVIKWTTGATAGATSPYIITVKDASGRTVYVEKDATLSAATDYRTRISLEGMNKYKGGTDEDCAWRFQDGENSGVGEVAKNGVYTFSVENDTDGVVFTRSFVVSHSH